MIISGGYNVHPKEVEVEIEIDLIPDVLESAVVGLPHTDFGERVVAAVVQRQEALLEKRTLSVLKGGWLPTSCRTAISARSSCPRIPWGEIQKNVLCERYLGEFRG